MSPSEAFEKLAELSGADAIIPNAVAGEIGSLLLVAWEQHHTSADPSLKELGTVAGDCLIAWAKAPQLNPTE